MIDYLLTKLTNVKPSGKNQWMACCPAHEDRDPSMGIKLCDDGRILMNCLAGCDTLSILHSVNLEMKDLFPDNGLGELQSFQTLQNNIRQAKEKKQAEANLYHKTVLALAEHDRKQNLKLSAKDKEQEARAYLEARCKP